MAKNGPFVAITRPGSSKLVAQGESRLDQIRAHLGRCVGAFSWVQSVHQGPNPGSRVFIRDPKQLKKVINGLLVAISRRGGSKLVDQQEWEGAGVKFCYNK